MTDDKEKIEAESRANAEFKHPDKPDTAYFAFLDGVAWRDANPSPEVDIIVNVLKWYAQLGHDLYAPSSITETMIKMDGGDKAREALRAYRQKMGEK